MNVFIELGYLGAALSFILGLKLMSSPKRAQTGILVAAIGMFLAISCTLIAVYSFEVPSVNVLIIISALILGIWGGQRMAVQVEMTAMPQLVSLFNATGGGCAMLLGLIEMHTWESVVLSQGTAYQLLLLIGSLTGAIAFTGSIVAYLKLAGKIKDVHQTTYTILARVFIVIIFGSCLLFYLGFIPISISVFTYSVIGLSFVYGVLFVLPIGGADMPVVISLLNAITGIATALAGFMQENKAMIAGGIFVGAAGLLLTLLMCKAMNRSLVNVLAGHFNKTTNPGEDTPQTIQETSVAETITQLSFAQKIGVIPGYGMAIAQAQHECYQLQKVLEAQDKSIDYIIHPVAGRMPGHMNVLLAEAKIDYDYLKEMDSVNTLMETYDMLLVIGANDVVNPAAETNTASPIYGMPIIKAYQSKKIIVMKRGMSTGYAGIQNELFEKENCRLLFGDAKKSLQEIVSQMKMMN
ncbi:NAD(P)(+) transhydrogenase (Re/Si-specific) subunit beta [Mesonia aquimarina]|uniref:NAD(P)(+) transhydrogenase (Re/Si-specific) subunit beta n=1 Tax=Mesonia aquimarina TaxID=1504967 RepID=UPI001969632C|nr:NAD(P)(+) transhydrogenase (Re/Si-specific) subunit beta [Mesonia aquimarina]